MGQAGQLTRLLTLCFPQSLLTYAAPDAAAITAPGQLSVQTMIENYHVDALTPQSVIHLHFCDTEASMQAIIAKNRRAAHGETISIPLLVSAEEAGPLASGLRVCLSRLSITTDPALAEIG
jgi:hypothetical protein